MNNNIKVILVYISAWLTFYLIGSFCSASFNISKWIEDTRVIISVCLGFATVIFLAIMIAINVFPDEKK